SVCGEELKALLEHEGFEVALFMETVDALAVIEESDFVDLVITGWVGVDGLSIIKAAQNRGINFLILTASPHAVPANLQEKVIGKVRADPYEIVMRVNGAVFWATREFFRIIRLGTDFDPVIVVSPPDAGPDTVDAKYYRLASWQIGDDQPGVFNEISGKEAMSYFSGLADGVGFEEPPAKIFQSLDAVLQFVTKRRNEWYAQRLEALAD
ncbi:MAG: hypothetical protein FJ044_03525, partial [Candidatus Cloacimonetes bacterium]|nr:hypothetical protein [Candidatus Cloacimonadota bacterium]